MAERQIPCPQASKPQERGGCYYIRVHLLLKITLLFLFSNFLNYYKTSEMPLNHYTNKKFQSMERAKELTLHKLIQTKSFSSKLLISNYNPNLNLTYIWTYSIWEKYASVRAFSNQLKRRFVYKLNLYSDILFFFHFCFCIEWKITYLQDFYRMADYSKKGSWWESFLWIYEHLPWVPSMSFYPDFIQILSWFSADFLKPTFIQILSRFFPNFWKNLDKVGKNTLCRFCPI